MGNKHVKKMPTIISCQGNAVKYHITFTIMALIKNTQGFPGGVVVKNPPAWASLVAQWLRICLPMQGTGVRALVWEDPTCRGATRPVSHNC